MQVVIAPAVQFPLSLSLLLKSVLWAYARLQSSSWVNLATSCNLVHVLTFYNFSLPFGTYASRNRPCRPVPYGPMQRLCHPAHFFSFSVVSQNSSTQRKLQISNPRFPLLLFTLSNTKTHKLHYRSTSSQDPLQSPSAVGLAKLHASLLVVQDVHSTWPRFAKETFRSRSTSQASCSQTTSLPKEMPQPS